MNTTNMKIRVDLQLVKQLDYISDEFVDFSGDKCMGCVFATTRDVDNSMWERVNSEKHTCGADMIYVIDEEMWNSYKGIV